jgi:RNA polymerase sigma-70 factor (sigma-E family)
MLGGPRRDESFDEAFDKLFPRAQRLAERIVGDWMTAEDVAAEALARTCLRWSKLRDAPWRDGWTLRVTTNLALDVVRRKPPAVRPSAAPDASEAAVLRVALNEALLQLPRRQREVIALRYLSDLSEAEVAGALGISAGSVKTHTSRGLAALRTRMGDDAEEVDLALQ